MFMSVGFLSINPNLHFEQGGVVVFTLARDDAESARWQREGSEAQRWHSARDILVKAGIWEPIDEQAIEESDDGEVALASSKHRNRPTASRGRMEKTKNERGSGITAYAYRVLKSFEIRY